MLFSWTEQHCSANKTRVSPWTANNVLKYIVQLWFCTDSWARVLLSRFPRAVLRNAGNNWKIGRIPHPRYIPPICRAGVRTDEVHAVTIIDFARAKPLSRFSGVFTSKYKLFDRIDVPVCVYWCFEKEKKKVKKNGREEKKTLE